MKTYSFFPTLVKIVKTGIPMNPKTANQFDGHLPSYEHKLTFLFYFLVFLYLYKGKICLVKRKISSQLQRQFEQFSDAHVEQAFRHV